MKNIIILLTVGIFLIACSAENNSNEVMANTHTSFVIEGMTCEEMCAKRIEDKITRTKGVKECTVDFENNRATINYDDKSVDLANVVSMIEKMADKKYVVSEIKTEKISASNGDINSTAGSETGKILSTPSFEIPNVLEYFRNII